MRSVSMTILVTTRPKPRGRPCRDLSAGGIHVATALEANVAALNPMAPRHFEWRLNPGKWFPTAGAGLLLLHNQKQQDDEERDEGGDADQH